MAAPDRLTGSVIGLGGEGGLGDYTYSVFTAESAPAVRVMITDEALVVGDATYSRVRAQVLGRRTLNLATHVETYITPPFETEEQREHAALVLGTEAARLAGLDIMNNNNRE